MIYEATDHLSPITQGDILSNCPFLEARYTTEFALEVVQDISNVIVLTQACDIAQGKVSYLVTAKIYSAKLLVEQGILKDKLIREQIRRHQVYGWYFLPACNNDPDMEESLVDLRNLCTLPLKMVEQLVADGSRMGRLMSPFREHLAKHFADTYSRIPLPDHCPTMP